MLACEVQMSTPALADSASAQLGVNSELEMLQRLFIDFSEALHGLCTEPSKVKMNNLLVQVQGRGIYGDNALALIQKYRSQINWQGMSPEVFTTFYRFIYFLCREPNKRNVQVATAVAAWRLVLCGRFRLLDRFCSFVSSHHKSNVILEDTWRQVLDFSRTVHEDLSNYDPASAWPVLLDEFVEHVKGTRHANRPSVYVNVNTQPLDFLSPWSGRSMTAVSPRSGSKRRPPDILEVADQLQQLPLESSDCRNTAAMSNSGASTSPRLMLTAKRFRSGHSESNNRIRFQDAANPDSLGDRQSLMSAGDIAQRPPGSQGSMAVPTEVAYMQVEQVQQQQQQCPGDFTTGCVYSAAQQAHHHPLHHHHHHHHHHSHRPGGQSPVRTGGQPAGLLSREHGHGSGRLCHQQSTPGGVLSLGGSSTGTPGPGFSMGRSMEHHNGLQRQQPHMGMTGGVDSQQPHGSPGGLLYGAQLPPCPSPGGSSRSGMDLARRSMDRAHNVNVMMQATVTEALGFLH